MIFLAETEVTLNVGSTPVGNTYAPYSLTSYELYTGKINLEVNVSPTLSAVSPLVFHSIPEASLNSNSTVEPTFIPSLPRTWNCVVVSYEPSALNLIVFPEGVKWIEFVSVANCSTFGISTVLVTEESPTLIT